MVICKACNGTGIGKGDFCPNCNGNGQIQYNETEMGNILVKQKNFILSFINQGAIKEARAMLECVKELWFACDYGYKCGEINERLKREE